MSGEDTLSYFLVEIFLNYGEVGAYAVAMFRKLFFRRGRCRFISASLIPFHRRLWSHTRDVFITNTTPWIQRSGVGFPLQKIEYPDLGRLFFSSLRVQAHLMLLYKLKSGQALCRGEPFSFRVDFSFENQGGF